MRCRRLWIAWLFIGVSSAACGANDAGKEAIGTPDGATSPRDAEGDARAYAGHLKVVICDVKRPLAGLTTPLDGTNYVTVLDALASKLGCNGVRLYIDPAIDDPANYSKLYTAVLQHARVDLALAVYANPLGTGNFGKDNTSFANWIVKYANAVKPDFLGPFNESGLVAADYEDIAQKVRSGLAYQPVLIGPDVQKVGGTLKLLDASSALTTSFDVIGSHNAVDDTGATSAGWLALQLAAGRDTWSTENPRPWSFLDDAGAEVGVKAVVGAPIGGVVIYEAFPDCVGSDGALTVKGTVLAAGLAP